MVVILLVLLLLHVFGVLEITARGDKSGGVIDSSISADEGGWMSGITGRNQ